MNPSKRKNTNKSPKKIFLFEKWLQDKTYLIRENFLFSSFWGKNNNERKWGWIKRDVVVGQDVWQNNTENPLNVVAIQLC